MGFMDRLTKERPRSTSRSRREDRRSSASLGTLRQSQESIAGGLSPGRSQREGQGLSGLFGSRSKSASKQRATTPPEEPVPKSGGSPSRLKQLLSFAPGHSPREKKETPFDQSQSKDLQHKVQLLQAQLPDYEDLKRKLVAEQRTANEWKEKWNYQNFKLNLVVDMLVLRVLETEQQRA